jgi:hypothetical protein
VVPPVPIPNTEVKRCSPNGSASLGCARVGRRQNYEPRPVKAGRGSLVSGLLFSLQSFNRPRARDGYRLRVLDFGGSPGISYFHSRAFLQVF